MFPLAVLGSQGIVVKCTAAIIFRTVVFESNVFWTENFALTGRILYQHFQVLKKIMEKILKQQLTTVLIQSFLIIYFHVHLAEA